MNELTLIKKQLDTATPERCISIIQLLSKSLNIVNIEKKGVAKLCCRDYEEYCENKYEEGKTMINLIQCYGERLNGYLEKYINKQNLDSSNSPFSMINNQNLMPEINYEKVKNELKEIENELNMATPERCISQIQFLSKSLNIINIEKRVFEIPGKEWFEYCNKRYELGRIMIKTIQCYGDRLKSFL